jgi:hypothetical protein
MRGAPLKVTSADGSNGITFSMRVSQNGINLPNFFGKIRQQTRIVPFRKSRTQVAQ